ncbi:MAG: RHS repeat domain-containing protein [Rubrobacteraceae bacterium]
MYDGTGSVTRVGNDKYFYDLRQRMVTGSVWDVGSGFGMDQFYSYDAFGNIQGISGDSGRSTPTDSGTNRLTGIGTGYDAAGNLTDWNGNIYSYDAFNRMTRMRSGGQDWYYFYTADDERIWMYMQFTQTRWELRGLDNRVLAAYIDYGGVWARDRQVVYRDGSLLATKTFDGWQRLHLDHLGTPRAITNAAGTLVSSHAYYGFGEEVTAFDQDDERMKFTGHTRDLADVSSPNDDLDYMHARHYNHWTGRFLSPDPVGGRPENPQRWNRYAYALNKPAWLIDPTGLGECPSGNACEDSVVSAHPWVIPRIPIPLPPRDVGGDVGGGGRDPNPPGGTLLPDPVPVSPGRAQPRIPNLRPVPDLVPVPETCTARWPWWSVARRLAGIPFLILGELISPAAADCPNLIRRPLWDCEGRFQDSVAVIHNNIHDDAVANEMFNEAREKRRRCLVGEFVIFPGELRPVGE